MLKIAGMMMRVYIADKIGSEGMGVYQLILTVYSLFITFSTGGLGVAATCVASEILAREPQCMRRTMRRLLLLGLLIGGCCAAVLIFGAGAAAGWILRAPETETALRILGPSLVFMALSACVRGYFMANKNVTPNAKAQCMEQAVRIGLVVALLPVALTSGMQAAFAAIAVGNTCSEAFSWCYMYYVYRRSIKLHSAAVKDSGPLRWRYLLGVLLPVSGSQTLGGALHTAENILVPSCITAFTGSRSAALAQFGALKGMAMPVLFFPFSFISTLITLLLPDITRAFVKKQQKTLRRLIHRSFLITLALSVLCGAVFTIYAARISEALYHTQETTLYFRVLGPLMPLMYLESVADGILKGIDQQLATFKYCVADSVLRIILILFLTPRLGMMGFLYVMLCSNVFTAVLNIRRLCMVTGYKIPILQGVLAPMVSAAAAYAAEKYLFGRVFAASPALLALVAECAVFVGIFVLIYGAIMYKTLKNTFFSRKEKIAG